MHPFTARTFTLEHSEARTVLLRIEWGPADAVELLIIVGVLGKICYVRLIKEHHLVFKADVVFTFLRSIYISEQSRVES